MILAVAGRPAVQPVLNKMTKLHGQLAAAVRKSLNLPELQVSVRKGRRNWKFQLHSEGASSAWLDLEEDDIRVMKQLGLVPALHLGMFRVAYHALRLSSGAAKVQ